MLNRDIVLLIRLCDEVDGVTFDSLPGRIAFQKRIYVLQAAGVDLGYRFSWDLYGPYSRGLANAGAELDQNLEAARQLAKNLELVDEVRERAARARDAMVAPDAVDEGAWLELIASLHFLRVAEGQTDSTSAFSRLVELKPHLANLASQRGAAWSRVEALDGAAA